MVANPQPAGERIAKLIARAGVCSRREAEALVAQGRVEVDGQTLVEPGTRVRADQRVTIDGEPLPRPEPPRLWRYHKPRGVVTAAHDPRGRPVIYDRLPSELPRVMPIGRLDLTSEGLLLLTNDGALKRRLELPSTGWVRRYRVRVHGRVQSADLERLAAGLSVEGIDYGPVQARLDSQQGANAWLTVSLREGKNREIRRLFEHLGYTVSRLIRVAYGPFQLGKLADDAVEEIAGKVLAEQLGRDMAEQIGVSAGAGAAARASGRGRAKPAAAGQAQRGQRTAKRETARRRDRTGAGGADRRR